ncbi:hypothetical protein DB30_00182 [Enhygromyxa salina]|uniref:Uncharacterized protein n=1 Tax=Enhygromyxa salina TaxID=215803 RepID=A0A0C2DFT5_9BACT|nr:hypothetical protein [Enhygromyxa salina]KIG18497.1 hypothetical protein DB30_00182 [Enhygromyxa salina]
MSPPPRRLSFAVGTSLLTASLSLGVAGCDEQTSNPGPDRADKHPEPEGPTVNQVAPELEPVEPDPVAPSDAGLDPEQVEGPHVNEGPEPEPEPIPPPDPQVMVNPASVPDLEPATEPKRVNTRPEAPSQD